MKPAVKPPSPVQPTPPTIKKFPGGPIVITSPGTTVSTPRVNPQSPVVSPGPRVNVPTTPPKIPDTNKLTIRNFDLDPSGRPISQSPQERAIVRNLRKVSPSRIPAGALRAATGLPASFVFITLSALIDSARSEQVHEQQKSEVGKTYEFNKYFVDHIRENPIILSEIVKVRSASTGMNKPGAIGNMMSDDQAYDILIMRKRHQLLDQFYDDVYMPRLEKAHMLDMMSNPTRSQIDDRDLQFLIDRHPDYWDMNHEQWVPRTNKTYEDKPPAPDQLSSAPSTPMVEPLQQNNQQIDDMYEQVMLALQTPVNNTQIITSKPTSKYSVTDDYQDITSMNTDMV